MTSPRGLKFLFQPGETVLCFEPDPSKARVLYQAKILEQITTRTNKGKTKADYQIHFQGWNHSWDRVVPQSFVLKNSLENRQLMRKLAQIARHTGRNKDRMKKIDNILKANRKKPKFDSESSETSSDDDGDDDNEGNTTAETEDDVTTSDQEMMRMSDDGEDDDDDLSQNGINQNESEEEEEADLEKLEAEEEFKEVTLELTDRLKKLLEEDCVTVNKRRKLVKLPANPNIVTILEGYVKNFGINVLCATVEKTRPTREQWQHPAPEKNVELCKEVVDGIRVFFDFTLPTALLYNFERAQYAKITSTYKPKADLSQEIKSDQEEQNSRLRNRVSLSELNTEGSPKLARQSPRAIKKEPVEVKQEVTSEPEEAEPPPPRRMTRHAFAEECQKSPKPKALHSPTRRSKGSHSQDSAPEPDSDVAASGEHGRRPGRRGRGRPPNPERAEKVEKPDTPHAPPPPPPDTPKKQLADRVTPPPPIALPGSVSSHSSSGQQSPTASSAAEYFLAQSRRKEEAVNDICNWKLVPDNLYSSHPTPPSIVYGAQHLLRLFVRLPDLLSQMPMDEQRRRHLVKHLEMLVEYMDSRVEQLFGSPSYVDAD